MNKALFIVSLQHELSMAIGNEINLEAMLKVFLKVCFNRFNLTSAHIYINKNTVDSAARIVEDKTTNTKHLLSIPKKKRGELWQNNPILSDFSKRLINGQENINYQCKNSNFLFGFIIPEHGAIIFETRFFIEIAIQKALKPILKKLATSCYTSIIHDSLVQEIAARKTAEDKMSYQARHDGLTGIYNRRYFNLLLDESFNSAINHNTIGSVIFVDLNQFKPINDAMGHTVGDHILITLAQRLKGLANKNIKIARFGGDEFIFLISNLKNNKQDNILCIQEIIKKINNTLETPFIIDSGSYKLNCSIGYAFFPENTIHNVVKCADLAMYEAKRCSTTNGLIYQPKMSDKINRRLAYIEEMKQGLIKNEFQLFYQPQYNSQHEIIGAEALLRWHHPNRGMESPEIYIPIAEESDLILDIGQWVLEQACHDIAILEQSNLPKSFKKISINVSAKQLIQYDFKESVLSNIEKYNILANRLSLELTENLLVESFESSIQLIDELKAHGVDCCIDDFGTGYSSLTYLKRIPANVLKIDRSFVTNIHKDNESTAIANMIISLGKTLNMTVLAEGVETEDELNCLKSLGCYQYQGYYFSKPIPFEQLININLG
ncbi:MAG: bifunctional diguanylate cyclase/phosphodiesterase [Colwellia sp.]